MKKGILILLAATFVVSVSAQIEPDILKIGMKTIKRKLPRDLKEVKELQHTTNKIHPGE